MDNMEVRRLAALYCDRGYEITVDGRPWGDVEALRKAPASGGPVDAHKGGRTVRLGTYVAVRGTATKSAAHQGRN